MEQKRKQEYEKIRLEVESKRRIEFQEKYKDEIKEAKDLLKKFKENLK